MTIKEFEHVVSIATYKPGYKFSILRENSFDAYTLRLSYQAIDVNDPKNIITLVSTSTVFQESIKSFAPDDVVGLLCSVIKRAELHEMDEWFEIGGVRVKEPHPETKS